MKYLIFITAGILLFSLSLYAHGDESHGKREKKQEQNEMMDSNGTTMEMDDQKHEASAPFSTNPNPGMSDFPSKHPMVVHFPIVLLLIAFFMQIASFFVWKKELSLITLIMLIGGAAGAYIASNFAHPHTSDLNEIAAQILTVHEDYAAYAKWGSIVAVVLKAISHFYLKRKLWGEIIVALILAGSALSVSQAGHYGAALTHLHGIGIHGEFLENASHSHED